MILPMEASTYGGWLPMEARKDGTGGTVAPVLLKVAYERVFLLRVHLGCVAKTRVVQ